jgi:hypothetical protein
MNQYEGQYRSLESEGDQAVNAIESSEKELAILEQELNHCQTRINMLEKQKQDMMSKWVSNSDPVQSGQVSPPPGSLLAIKKIEEEITGVGIRIGEIQSRKSFLSNLLGQLKSKLESIISTLTGIKGQVVQEKGLYDSTYQGIRQAYSQIKGTYTGSAKGKVGSAADSAYSYFGQRAVNESEIDGILNKYGNIGTGKSSIGYRTNSTLLPLATGDYTRISKIKYMPIISTIRRSSIDSVVDSMLTPKFTQKQFSLYNRPSVTNLKVTKYADDLIQQSYYYLSKSYKTIGKGVYDLLKSPLRFINYK